MLTLQLKNNDYIIINSFILFIFALLVANGDINILASQDISNGGSKYSQDSISMSYDIFAGTLTIPTYSHTSQTNNNSSLKNNNSTIISEIGNINIESKNKDINIKGANIETKEQDINLLATNGNMNIESTQDMKYSNTDGSTYSVGQTIGYGQSKDLSDVIKNNYTTIIAGSNKGSNGKVNINTNDLNLVGINEETKDNLLKSETSTIKGNITETQLEEKNIHDSYAYSVNYNIPISINTELGVGSAVNEALNDLISKTGDNKIANYFNQISNDYQAKFGNTINPDQGNINTQMPVQVGDWLGSLGNITVHYENDEGLNFTASPASVLAGGAVTFEVLQSLRQLLNEIPNLLSGKDINSNKDLEKYLAGKTKDDVIKLDGYDKDDYGFIKTGQVDESGYEIVIPVNVDADGNLKMYTGAVWRTSGTHNGIEITGSDGKTYFLVGFNTVGMINGINQNENGEIDPNDNHILGMPVVDPKFYQEGSKYLSNIYVNNKFMNFNLESKWHDGLAEIFDKLPKPIATTLTVLTTPVVLLSPIQNLGMPDGGYNYGSILNYYYNNVLSSIYFENQLKNKLEIKTNNDLNINLDVDLNNYKGN